MGTKRGKPVFIDSLLTTGGRRRKERRISAFFILLFCITLSVYGAGPTPEAWWKLDEGEGNIAYDNSGNGYDGSIYGDPARISGVDGMALRLDGVYDYAEAAGYTGVTGGGDRTICAWIRTSGPGAIVSYGAEVDGIGAKWAMTVNSLGSLQVHVWGGTVYGATLIDDDRWHHTAAVLRDVDFNGLKQVKDIRLYVDGVPETLNYLLSPDTIVNTASQEPVHMGALNGYGDTGITSYLPGVLDDVRIYNTALNTMEIQELAYVPLVLPGNGTQEDPYQISTALQIVLMGTRSDLMNQCFVLMNDIDLSEYKFGSAVIASVHRYFDPYKKAYVTTGVPFSGVFDGNGYAVKNMTIDITGKRRNYLGLFGQINGSGAEVINLGIENSTITEGDNSNRVGGLVGENVSGFLMNCYAHVSIGSCGVAGGLAGANFGLVSGCYSTGTVAGAYSVGGLVGGNAGLISDCYSNCTVNSDSHCSVWAPGDYGGLVGYNRGSIQNSFSTGYLSGIVSSGGLCGYQEEDTAEMTNCFWDTETSGQGIGYRLNSTRPGVVTNVLGKTTVEMKMQTTFTEYGWDFVGETTNGIEDIWFIRPDEYPRLWWENLPPLANAGEDQVVYAGMDGLAEIQLDGTGSFDPDGDLLEYFWYDANGLIAAGPEPNVILPVGEHIIDLIVNDGIIDSEPNDVVITVIGPLEAEMFFVPRVLNVKSCGRYVMAILELPKGISVKDLDQDEPWRLLPGEVEALFVRTISNHRHQMVFAVFDRDEVIGAIDLKEQKCRPGRFQFPRRITSNEAEITVYSKLETGQMIGVTDTIRIIEPVKAEPKPKASIKQPVKR